MVYRFIRQTCFLLFGQHTLNIRRWWTILRYKDPQRLALFENDLYVKYLHVNRLDQMLERMERVKAHMVMIDLVKCSVLDKAFDPVHFAYKCPLIPDELCDAFEYISDRIGVGEYIVRHDHFCLPVFRDDVVRYL